MTRELRWNRRLAEELEIVWYRSEDLVLGYCGVAGNQGVYRFWLDHSDEWQFFPAETENWDYYHQMIFRSCRGDDCKFGDIVDQVPSLPAEFPPPDKYHVKDPIEIPVFPSDDLLKKVRAAPDERLPVYVLLKEDPYETSFGDGIFRNFESAYLDEDAAKARIQQLLREPPRITIESNDPTDTRFVHDIHYIRKVYLALSEGALTLDTEDCDLSPYDHFTKEKIVSYSDFPDASMAVVNRTMGAGTAKEVGRRRHE